MVYYFPMLGNLFTCFPVPESGTATIHRATRDLKLPEGWRLVEPSEWHITLAFIGPHEPDAFAGMLEGLVVDVPPLEFTGWSFFPHPGRARVLALSGPPPTALSALVAELTRRAEGTGWTARFAKPFVLHNTVARGPVGPAFEVPAIEPVVIVPERLALLQTQSINPATYREIVSVPCASTSSDSPSTT